MAAFEVWAPYAGRVDVVLGGLDGPAGRRVAMNGPDGAGWFRVEVAEAGPGDDYAFSLDGGDPLPDPRSPWQPAGVHGPSRLVDHSAFAWTDGGWEGRPLDGTSLVYELHVGTFSPEGSFDGVVARLDHLVDLGVTHVELMPVAEFPGAHGWGYDGVDLWGVRHAYGGPEGLRRLVDACHARGLAVVLDVVYNHLGPAGNHLGRFGPYFTDRYGTPWGQAVNLDGPDSDAVREFVLGNALMWLRDYHLDGLRLDAVHAIYDLSALHILEELSGRVDELEADTGRKVVLIAESDLNDPRVVRDPAHGGYGVDAQWSDDFHHALHAVLTGERSGYYRDFGSLTQVGKALRQAYVYDGAYSPSRRRRHGRPPSAVPALRFLGYLQTHDQVGNRACGERMGHLVGVERLKVGVALVLCSPFVPMLFAGEEWAASAPFQYFTDHEDPDLGRAVSEGRRREFGAFGWKPEDVPDPQDPATFSRSCLDWSERDRSPHAEVLAWYRDLVRLRRDRPALCDGSFVGLAVRVDEEAGWLVVERGNVSVAANLGPSAAALEVGEGDVVASSGDVSAAGPVVTLGPDSVAVVAHPVRPAH
jgi:maltooligosyltrehalose trehalohydrolase